MKEERTSQRATMSATQLGGVLRHIHQEALRQGGPSDGELLEPVLQRHDERAFDLLLLRHGSLVWGVCLRVLRNPADAEDAFQATFLVLLARGATLRRREALGAWLHAVAYRTALKARLAGNRRRLE